MIKNPPANAGDTRDSGLIPGLGRFPGVGNDNPLHYFCLENFMEPGGLQSMGVTRVNMHICMHELACMHLENTSSFSRKSGSKTKILLHLTDVQCI